MCVHSMLYHVNGLCLINLHWYDFTAASVTLTFPPAFACDSKMLSPGSSLKQASHPTAPRGELAPREGAGRGGSRCRGRL